MMLTQGDTQIKYFEITDKPPYVFFLSMYQPKGPQRGAGVMPKRELDYMKCEVMRFYVLRGIMVEPTPLTVPRKVRWLHACMLHVAAHGVYMWQPFCHY